MTLKDASPTATTNLTIAIGADNYELHVSNFNIPDPSTSIIWRGGTPAAKYTDILPGDYVANVTLVNDYQTEGSLFLFLLEHAGETATWTYKPDADGTFEITTDVTMIGPTIGGAVNAFNESTIAMPCTKPAVTPVV